MKRKHRRLSIVVIAMLGLGASAALILTALEDNIVFFFSPTEVAENPPAAGRRLRIGGLVKEDSVRRLEDGITTAFVVTDLANDLQVSYRGVLPDLFREGQGVVAEGTFDPQGTFLASEVLAKHDENYMPAEVTDALRKSGRWQEESSK